VASTPSDLALDADLPLLQASMRINTLIFCVIFGLIAGAVLFALGLAAGGGGHAGLVAALIGVFLPGFGAGFAGALAGLVWGALIGAALGAAIYWLNYRAVLGRVDELVALDTGDADFPVAVLRLSGRALGLAIGTMGALGLVVTTNWLVLRGTAQESTHAKLLAQVLPGYRVDFVGSLIGAAELFALLFVCCVIFASVYNRVVALRHPEA
jgi:hypothetical protein